MALELTYLESETRYYYGGNNPNFIEDLTNDISGRPFRQDSAVVNRRRIKENNFFTADPMSVNRIAFNVVLRATTANRLLKDHPKGILWIEQQDAEEVFAMTCFVKSLTTNIPIANIVRNVQFVYEPAGAFPVENALQTTGIVSRGSNDTAYVRRSVSINHVDGNSFDVSAAGVFGVVGPSYKRIRNV